jgi:hypothetical protein
LARQTLAQRVFPVRRHQPGLDQLEFDLERIELSGELATVRYRGLSKNTHRLLVTCALANLFMARRHLLQET